MGEMKYEYVSSDDDMLIGEVRTEGVVVVAYSVEDWPEGEEEPIVEHVGDNRAAVYWRLDTMMALEHESLEEAEAIMSEYLLKSFAAAREKFG